MINVIPRINTPFPLRTLWGTGGGINFEGGINIPNLILIFDSSNPSRQLRVLDGGALRLSPSLSGTCPDHPSLRGKHRSEKKERTPGGAGERGADLWNRAIVRIVESCRSRRYVL